MGSRRSASTLAVITLVVIVVICAGIVALRLSTIGKNKANHNAITPHIPTTTQTMPTVTQPSVAATTVTTAGASINSTTTTTPNIDLPGQATPVADDPGHQHAGFGRVYTNGPTSPEFALLVRDEYLRASGGRADTQVSLDVYSPITGRNYTMNCVPAADIVRCTGGNSAEVYLTK